MYTPKVIFVIVSVLLALSTQVQTDKLKVTVYYEVLCPDSIRFIVRQLHPTYKKIGDYLDLDLVPYGKADQSRDNNGKWNFHCQHGPAECFGNKMDACILNQTLNSDQKLNLISCCLKAGKPYRCGRTCAADLNIAFEPIEQCANSNLGGDLLAYYGDRTDSAQPRITFVPTVVFDNKYDPWLQGKALTNLLSTACELFPSDNKPENCQQ